MFSYTFPGEVPSKKNSKQLICVKGRSILLPSKNYRAWEKIAKSIITLYGRPVRPLISAKLNIRIFHGDLIKRDTNNATQGIQDVLVDMGVLVDDNWMVIGSPNVSHFIDIKNPRMEVDVIEQEAIDYKEIFKRERKKLPHKKRRKTNE